MQDKKKVVIAGGGTAGWMTAAALSKLLGKNLNISLIESDEIGTVGVGEATIPTLHIFHELLGIKENEVMAATNATFKLGISFEGWRNKGKNYLHSFGFLGKDCWAAQFHHFWLKGYQQGVVSDIGDYCVEHLAAREGRFGIYPNQERNHAYHLDASLYAKYLRGIAEKHGVRRVEGKIKQVNLRESDGFIESLKLESGELFNGDLFIDCTGFGGLLIEKALHTGYEDWSHWLPCDKAVAVQTTAVQPPIPYTRSIAHEAGWQWRIPLQNRTGNGLVFCSKYWSDEEATERLLSNVEGELLTTPRVIAFKTGTRRLHWNKNCVAIGLSSGFIEPLESTSIHLIQRSIVKLMLLFPNQTISQADIDEFNHQMREELEHIRDFIVLHYHLTERKDSEFWRYCRRMNIPSTLRHRMDLFAETGRIYKYDKDLFGEASWVQVMMGQGLMPQSYHPIVDLMGEQELKGFLDGIYNSVRKTVAQLPNQAEFIAKYCPIKKMEKGDIYRGDYSINSQLQFVIHEIGEAKVPVIYSDSVCSDAGASLRAAAAQLNFEKDPTSMYPGVRAELPVDYTAQVSRKLIETLYEVYKIPRQFKPVIRQACFSLLTQPENSLTFLQKIPHFDSTNPYFFAILHYLGQGVHGNTGFFRHESTGFERITSENQSKYFQAANSNPANVKEIGLVENYMTDSNTQYQLYYEIPYATNRLAIYPGNLLHSILVKPSMDISWNVEHGRLTANFFIIFE